MNFKLLEYRKGRKVLEVQYIKNNEIKYAYNIYSE